MSDSISRQKAIDAVYQEFQYVYCHNCAKHLDEDKCGDCHRKYMNWSVSKEAVENVINAIPSAEPKKGNWIETDEYHGFNDEVNHKAIACSVCKVAFNGWYGYGVEEMIEDFRYCPNCGADMREEE